jgi:hypothetical protein
MTREPSGSSARPHGQTWTVRACVGDEAGDEAGEEVLGSPHAHALAVGRQPSPAGTPGLRTMVDEMPAPPAAEGADHHATRSPRGRDFG